VEARPLMREHDRVAVDEGRHAADAQPQPGGHAGQRGKQGHRLEARLGQEAVAGPDGVEEAGALRLRRQVDEICYLDGAKHDGAATASSSLSSGTAIVLSPHASARSAEIRWPVIMKSLPRVMPMRRSARWVPPLPGIIPSRTSGNANSDRKVASRKSQATASS